MKRVLVLLALVGSALSLSFEKVHLVDYISTTGNMLFRGDMPCNSTAFDYSNLVAYMQTRAQAAGVPFPTEYYITDYSFNNVFDMCKFEEPFWSDNSALGAFVNWPLGFAGILPPTAYPLAVAQQMATNGSVWKIDELPTRLETVRTQLTTKAASGIPQIVYMHCSAGCDRTGEFMGAYRILYENATTTEMYALDTSECGRSPNYFSTSALEWYCIYYEATTGVNIGNCETFATCKLFGSCTPTNSSSTTEAATDKQATAVDAAVDVDRVAPIAQLPKPAVRLLEKLLAKLPHDQLQQVLNLLAAAAKGEGERPHAKSGSINFLRLLTKLAAL